MAKQAADVVCCVVRTFAHC